MYKFALPLHVVQCGEMWNASIMSLYRIWCNSNLCNCYVTFPSKHAQIRLTTVNVICFWTFNLLRPRGAIDLGQHWLRRWPVTWRHQAITWTNVGFSLVMRFFTFYLRLSEFLFHLMTLTIRLIKLLPHLHMPRGQYVKCTASMGNRCQSMPNASTMSLYRIRTTPVQNVPSPPPHHPTPPSPTPTPTHPTNATAPAIRSCALNHTVHHGTYTCPHSYFASMY